jgi:hypothetical protein
MAAKTDNDSDWKPLWKGEELRRRELQEAAKLVVDMKRERGPKTEEQVHYIWIFLVWVFVGVCLILAFPKNATIPRARLDNVSWTFSAQVFEWQVVTAKGWSYPADATNLVQEWHVWDVEQGVPVILPYFTYSLQKWALGERLVVRSATAAGVPPAAPGRKYEEISWRYFLEFEGGKRSEVSEERYHSYHRDIGKVIEIPQ